MKLNNKKSIIILTFICIMLLVNATAFANTIQDSIVVKGTEKLIKDATTALMILAPIVGIILVVFFFLRKGAADEMDQKTWQKRINTAIYSVIGAEVAAVIINVVVSYYTTT